MDPARDARRTTHPTPFCFAVARPIGVNLPPLAPVRLSDDAAQALAVLVPLLGCGEEAAAMAFDGLSGQAQIAGAAQALAAIAREERVHDALLQQLRAALPAPTGIDKLLNAARRFHIRLRAGGPIAHLARIAALDAGVCTILSRLTRTGGVVAQDAGVRAMLHRIRHDEARHVATSRRLALDHGALPALRDAAAAAREALADTLSLAGAAFDTLRVDPDGLDRQLRRLPDGLLTR